MEYKLIGFIKWLHIMNNANQMDYISQFETGTI